MSAPVNCVCLHPNQGELLVGDQSGVIHIWDLRTDHNEQLVSSLTKDSTLHTTNSLLQLIIEFWLLDS